MKNKSGGFYANIGFTELIESELNAAIYNSDKEALKRFSIIIGEKLTKLEEIEKVQEETKSDIKMLIEVVKQGFEDMNKRFDMMFKFMNLGFSLITLLIVVFKFIH